MTIDQAAAWFAFANRKLEELRGPFDFWGQQAPMPAMFCDGHGVHRIDLQELRQALNEARDRALCGNFGENGPALGVTARQQFVELYAIIINTQRVEENYARAT